MRHTIELDAAAARRYLVQRLLARAGGPEASVGDVLRRLQVVQMDSIDVCGRLQDLVLRARLPGYGRHGWRELLYGPERCAFEYYAPNLSIIPLEHYRYFVRTMQDQSRRRPLSSEHGEIADRLLARIRDEGPLRARDAAGGGARTVSGWGMPRSVASHLLERLWLAGRLCVARREGFERWYDLPDRHLSEDLLALHEPGADLPDPREQREFHLRSRFRTLALVRPRRKEVAALGADAFVEVRVAGAPRPWYALREEEAALEAARDGQGDEGSGSPATLLAPLDPLIYDRDRTLDVFGFEYRWEVYTPARKRRWGYYVLPLLVGDRLVGRADPALDRATGILEIRSIHLEEGCAGAGAQDALHDQLAELARFLGASGCRGVGAGGE